MVLSAKKDKMDELLSFSAQALAEDNLRAFRAADTSQVCRPASLNRRVKHIINREYRKREYRAFYVYGRRFAAAVILVFTISFTMVLGVKAWRMALWSAVVEFFEDHLSITFVSEIIPPTTIEIVKEPVILREDWRKEVLLNTEKVYCIIYRFVDGKKAISYEQTVLSETKFLVDNENSTVQEILLGDYTATLIYRQNQQAYSLTWSDDKYTYHMNTFSDRVSLEELITIAESVVLN